MKLSQKVLKSLFKYHLNTGEFIRLVSSNGHPVGGVAGNIGMRGYRVIKIYGKSYRAHRLVWLYVHGRWPKQHIDHIDGNTGNNKLNNLREASRFENLANSRKYKNNKNGLKGVCKHKISGKWAAYISWMGKKQHLGLFETKESALKFRRETAEKLHGEFMGAS